MRRKQLFAILMAGALSMGMAPSVRSLLVPRL